uniref:Uncharacterized protein n=1 Tax=Anguilla anguilla TaxID=7936 RepID=A0A0E9Q5H8_ANGAN
MKDERLTNLKDGLPKTIPEIYDIMFYVLYVFAYTEHVPTIPDIIRIIIRFLTMLFCLYSIIMHVYL